MVADGGVACNRSVHSKSRSGKSKNAADQRDRFPLALSRISCAFFFVFSTTAKKSRSEESEKQVLLSKFSLLRFPQYFAPRLQVDLYK